MKELSKSASKIVFILLAAGAVLGFFNGNLSQDNFMILAISAFSFYFSHKGSKDNEYLGK